MEDFAGITVNSDVSWAMALGHMHKITGEPGCIIGAFWLAAPGSVSFSGFFEECFVSCHGVVLLISHVVFEIVFHLMLHVFKSSLNVMDIVFSLMFQLSFLEMVMSFWHGASS